MSNISNIKQALINNPTLAHPNYIEILDLLEHLDTLETTLNNLTSDMISDETKLISKQIEETRLGLEKMIILEKQLIIPEISNEE